MNENIKKLVDELGSKNNKVRKNALDTLLDMTQEKVDWVYEVWGTLVDKLASDNSYQRSIGIFLLSNLIKSDYEHRFFEVIDRYLELMEDEKFITSRQTIQTSWKVAIQLDELRDKIIHYLLKMFSENKFLSLHANLIRKDIIMSLCNIHNVYKDAVDILDIKFRIDMYCDEIERKELIKLLNRSWNNS